MRRHILLFPAVLIGGCMTHQPQPEAQVAQPLPATQLAHGQLIGLTTTELVGHFGSPAFQVREGTSLKLQFRNARCILDAYLYPSTGGALRVTYVDTRLPSGVDTSQAACISALEDPS